MTGEPLEEEYFRWLYSQVGSTTRRAHWNLLRQLHQKEFVWVVANDDNRLEDGRDLRNDFVLETDADPTPEWLDEGCSMLEMLIGLTKRLEFETGMPGREWFWILMENLGIQDCVDGTNYSHQDVDNVLDDVIWRTYGEDGKGGLFPLRYPEEDQRYVEIWYQLSAYLQENGG